MGDYFATTKINRFFGEYRELGIRAYVVPDRAPQVGEFDYLYKFTVPGTGPLSGVASITRVTDPAVLRLLTRQINNMYECHAPDGYYQSAAVVRSHSGDPSDWHDYVHRYNHSSAMCSDVCKRLNKHVRLIFATPWYKSAVILDELLRLRFKPLSPIEAIIATANYAYKPSNMMEGS